MSKLNINCGTNILNGWVNIDMRPPPPELVKNGELFVIGDTKHLDQISGDNESEEIIFNLPLNVLSPDDITNYINKWKSKLKIGGKLSVWLTDCRKIGLGLHNSSLQLPEAHELLLGKENNFKCLIDTTVLLYVAKGLGFKVLSITPSGFFVAFSLEKTDENTQN